MLFNRNCGRSRSPSQCTYLVARDYVLKEKITSHMLSSLPYCHFNSSHNIIVDKVAFNEFRLNPENSAAGGRVNLMRRVT